MSFPSAGMSTFIASAMENFTVEELMHGWQQRYSSFVSSRSMSRCTAFSLSFISPSTLTEPGVMSSSRSMWSALAKLKREEPICLERSFVLKGFVPGISSR